MAEVCFHAVGRRKKAIARVRLIPGEGNIIINKRTLDDFFGMETLKMLDVGKNPLTDIEPLRQDVDAGDDFDFGNALVGLEVGLGDAAAADNGDPEFFAAEFLGLAGHFGGDVCHGANPFGWGDWFRKSDFKLSRQPVIAIDLNYYFLTAAQAQRLSESAAAAAPVQRAEPSRFCSMPVEAALGSAERISSSAGYLMAERLRKNTGRAQRTALPMTRSTSGFRKFG